MKVKCTICEQEVEEKKATQLIPLTAHTPVGWECSDCDEAARNAEKIHFHSDHDGCVEVIPVSK